jgi:hypothetical protein
MQNLNLQKLNEMLKKYILRWLLPKLIEKRSPSNEIPRSGKEGEKVNCYSVHLCDEEGKFIYSVTGLSKTKKSLILLSRNNNISTKILKSISLNQFIVTHFYGLDTKDYNNIYNLAFNFVFKFDVFIFKCRKLWNFFIQYFFNRKELTIKNSMELLNAIIDYELNPDLDPLLGSLTKNGVGVASLMTKQFSIRWLDHPNKEIIQKKLQLYLESFVESGDLKVNKEQYSVTYSITPKALKTLEIYEENERKHKDNVRLQWLLVIFTAVMTLTSIFQYLAS